MKSVIRLIGMVRKFWWLLVLAGVSLIGITAMNLISPWMVRSLTALLTTDIDEKTLQGIFNIAIILTASYLLRAVFRFGYQYLSHFAAWKVVKELRVRVYDHLQKLSLRYYHDKQTGQIMSRTINDTAVLELLVAHAIPDIITNLLILIGVTIILFIINAPLTALTLIPVPFIFILSYLFSKRVLPKFRITQQALAELNATLQDNISGIREIQAFNQQRREREKITDKAEKFTKAMLRSLKLSAIFHPSIEFVTSLGTVIVVGFGGYLAVHRGLSVPDIVAFLLYLSMFYTPVAALARVSEELSQSIAGAERVFEVLDCDPDIYDMPDAKPVPKSQGQVTFENVNFFYNEDIKILSDINIDIKPGQMVALVGPTGVGKSTLASLIPRFYDPVSGKVYLDGKDIRGITLKSLRDNISIVLQDVFLFNGTIADNIAYGMENVTIDDIIRAAKAAHIDEFISGLPEGYDTQIGERGVRLSGGQKQRISIARAVLRDSAVLILDEATASVDVETESEIQAAINEMAGTRTIIIIAHRLSTIRKCDIIYVLEEGKVVEQGSHDELVNKTDGLYARLCLSQTEIRL